MHNVKLIYRVLTAVLLLPFTVAGIIPAVIIILDPWRQPVFFPGLIVPAGGIAITVFCVRDFFRMGGGTPAPWDAPQNLVAGGLYRYCRNPMYIGVILTIAGLSLFFTSPLVIVYAVLVAAAFHLRVVRYEEPQLMQQFGQRWVLYSAMTNRWLPKFR